MPLLSDIIPASQSDVALIENQLTLDERLPERSVLDVFIASAARDADHTAITMLMTGAPDESPRQVSYGQLLGLIRQAANAFHTLGGARAGVAYMLPSLVETQTTLWAAATSGYAVPINFLLQTDPIAGLIEASGARILVALGPHPVLDIWSKALALQARMPGLLLVRVGHPGTPTEPGVIDFHAALAAQPADRLVFENPGQDHDVAAYFHTGGTTGTPKLVAHTHRGQLVAALGGALMAGLNAGDRMTATLPLFHVGGTIYGSLSVFMAGATLIVMSPSGLRNPVMVRGFWKLVEQYQCTRIGAVPTSIGAIVEVPMDDANISSVRGASTGAASIPAAVLDRFYRLTGIRIGEIYGMTEASGLISIRTRGDEQGDGSVGWALPYTKVVVARLDAGGQLGAECAANEIGVITVHGPHVSPGYRNPEHNTGVIENGVLNTGDLGFTDSEGRIRIAGRAKDLIIRSGHNIDPLMIENAMALHPAVLLAAAVGMPDAYAGELPVCFVALRPGAQVTHEALQAHAQQAIGERPAWPKHIYVVDAIPMTSVGKIFKPELRCDAAERLVRQLVDEQLGVTGAQVAAQLGGPRGMKIMVTLPESFRLSIPLIEEALAKYLFESMVRVAI